MKTEEQVSHTPCPNDGPGGPVGPIGPGGPCAPEMTKSSYSYVSLNESELSKPHAMEKIQKSVIVFFVEDILTSLRRISKIKLL